MSDDKPEGAGRTGASEVLTRIRDDVVAGQLEPGQPLRVAALVRRYGVGKTPLREALSRLAPLVGSGDSYDRLHAFLAAWPEVDEDPVATATRQAVAGRMALQAVDRRARDHLVNAKEDRTHGHEIVGHLDKLTRWLGSEERTEALVEAQVERWNTKAHELLNKVIRATPPPRPPTPKPPPGRHVRPVFTGRNVDLKDPSSLKNTLAELEQELAKSPQGKVRITVQIEWDE